ncbi:hypothetical protein [Stenotrophomonas sp. PFBMAA-4]|uniref:hypothetical protein n=1 Tax=Stenotrophomonas sp. PFBMAA-4 TaxID=3043301 RepID=UPI0024B59C43|nr:hypothetical protein [Stenotrophomonas sp. PFBMAA-4]MDI9272329.1 hypothetical protein [Stenotrophomonas sp. PFBMAA-4]
MKTAPLAALLILAAFPSWGKDCPAETTDTPAHRLTSDLQQEHPVIIAGCYRGTRHGLSLHDCSSGFGSGVWLELADGLDKDPYVDSFMTTAFRMQAQKGLPPLHVRVSGQLERSDAYVPGGVVFRATALHCFESPPDIRAGKRLHRSP